MSTLFKVLSFCPLWLAHAMGWALGWLSFGVSGIYRNRFIFNARLAGLPNKAWMAAVGESGKLVMELPRLWLGRPVPTVWEGAELVDDALAKHLGIVFLTPHLGCFEITAQAYAQRYSPYDKPMTVLFRPPRQPWLRELVQASRQRPGLLTAPTTLSGVKQMIKALKNGESVGLLPDQVPPLGMGMMVPFFGKDAYTMTLSVRLVQQTGATVLLAWGERLSWGRGFKVHVEALKVSLPDNLQAAVADVNRAMEQLVMRCPEQYLWGYARYKMPCKSH
jgi:KDO2-lipid IV(A) lauroyltransferase